MSKELPTTPLSYIPIAVVMADFHWTINAPRCRQEVDIKETLNRKLAFVVDVANKLDVPLVSAGDFFDSWKCSHESVNLAIAILRDLERPFLAVFGQHELPYHDYLRKVESPLATVLHACGKDLIGKPYTLQLTDADTKGIKVSFYGLSWKEKKNAGAKDPKNVTVLVQHKMVWEDKPPFPTEEKGDVTTLFNEDPYKRFNAIVTGDNHQAFAYQKAGRVWINCGCVLRTSATEMGHVPTCWILYVNDTGDMTCKDVPVPYALKNVSREVVEHQKSKELADSKFIKHLEVSPLIFDYEEIVKELMRKKEASDSVRHLVEKSLDEARLAISLKRKQGKRAIWRK